LVDGCMVTRRARTGWLVEPTARRHHPIKLSYANRSRDRNRNRNNRSRYHFRPSVLAQVAKASAAGKSDRGRSPQKRACTPPSEAITNHNAQNHAGTAEPLKRNRGRSQKPTFLKLPSR
jgi:hypothetical protein